MSRDFVYISGKDLLRANIAIFAYGSSPREGEKAAKLYRNGGPFFLLQSLRCMTNSFLTLLEETES